MINKRAFQKLDDAGKAAVLATEAHSAKKFTAFRPDNPASVRGFLHGWVPTLGGITVTMPEWPEAFPDRASAKAAAKAYREAQRAIAAAAQQIENEAGA